MIAIFANDEEILKYLPQIGLGRHKVRLNPADLTGITCIVQVGGHMVRQTHCYVQQERGLPYIQCMDPATTRAEPINKVYILCALEKARRIVEEGYQPSKVDAIIEPSISQVTEFCHNIPADAEVSVDLECDRESHEISVFGLGYMVGDICKVISIPIISENRDYWIQAEEEIVWQEVAKVLSSGRPKIMQNFIFDTMMLSYFGIKTNGRISCTMTAAHWIQPELPKGLDDLGRLYLMVDVWKGQQSWVSNRTLWEYNAKDVAYTMLILAEQRKALKDENRLSFYENHLTLLAAEVLRVCERGWTLDNAALDSLKATLEDETRGIWRNLQDFTHNLIRPKIDYIRRKGKPKDGVRYIAFPDNLVPASGNEYAELAIPPGTKRLADLGAIYEKRVSVYAFNPNSPLDVKEVLKALGINVPTKDGKETTDEVHLLRLLESPRVPESAKEGFLRPLLEYRGKAKMLSTYANVAKDFDDRVRFSITIPGTVEGRFSSKQTPWGTGFNSQNVPKSFRRMVVPSRPDWVIVNMDFKQADPHMVAWLSGSDSMLRILNDPKGDLHAHTASGIFGYDITTLPSYKDSKERKLGKACNNGLNYGMQAKRFVETCRKQGLTLTMEEALAAHKGYFNLYPNISEWQESVRTQINRTRTLTTPFGRKRYFYGFINDKLYNDAFSYIAPTTVADALNAGWLKMSEKREELSFEVLAQVHDSLVLQCPASELDATCRLMLNCYREVTFDVGKYKRCCLPVDIEVGKNWGELEPWKSS